MWNPSRRRSIASATLSLSLLVPLSAGAEPPTAAESQRLDEAEEMLNELAKEEGAAPEGTAPPTN